MTPCLHPPLPPSLPLLSCSSSSQLADLCALLVPCIWAGSFKHWHATPLPITTMPIISTKRYNSFKMFCHKLLKATQISCACVMMALWYIHRLHSAYPSVRASMGSEARLFTTALVLANKFLDDNTYTNKTWSDVSNIPVQELNIMEVEFLSALDYNIYTHHQQFFAWVAQCQQYWQQQQQQPAATAPPVMMQHPQQAQHQHYRTLKMPTTRVKPCPSSTTIMASSHSMPNMVFTKRPNIPYHHHQPYIVPPIPSKRNTSRHVPCTPPDEVLPYHLCHHPITTTTTAQLAAAAAAAAAAASTAVPAAHYPLTPLYTPQTQDFRYSAAAAPSSTHCTTTTMHPSSSSLSTKSQPILSWSSSTSALASSQQQHNNTHAFHHQQPILSAIPIHQHPSHRIRCLEID